MAIDNHSVLVTGGAGYIGSHACKALAAAGYIPVVYDDLSKGHDWAVKWGELEQGNVLDEARLEEAFDRHNPVAVMHFAAFIAVGESVEDPSLYYRNNIGGTMALLNVMRRQGVKNLVFSSTAAVYGDPQQVPIPESHVRAPVNPYGMSKYVAECMMADHDPAYGLRFVALRYFNAAGGDAELDTGEDHEPETHIIPLVLQVANGQRDHFTVFGTDYDTADGTCIRDYIHVGDLVDAHVLALGSLLQGGPSGYYNLGNGEGFSVNQVIEAARKVTGHPIPIVEGQRRAGDPPVLVADSRLIRETFGWSPKFPELETQVADAWAWSKKNLATS